MTMMHQTKRATKMLKKKLTKTETTINQYTVDRAPVRGHIRGLAQSLAVVRHRGQCQKHEAVLVLEHREITVAVEADQEATTVAVGVDLVQSHHHGRVRALVHIQAVDMVSGCSFAFFVGLTHRN